MKDLEKDPVYQAAVEWLMRLQDVRLTFEDSLEWQRWMSSDPRHAHTFERLEAVWEQPWELMRQRKGVRWRMSATTLTIAASVLICALVLTLAQFLGWLNVPFPSYGSQGQIIRTGIGENRSLTLSDGSRLDVGGGTELEVVLRASSRRIDLKHGEALFKVAHDARRPFSVQAGAATITALGTEFNIRRGSEKVIVAVMEGRVLVAPKSLPKPIAWLQSHSGQRAPAALNAGDRAIVEKDGIHSTIHMANAEEATAWQSGQLIFRDEPLRDALEDVNRYADKPIVIEDDSIGDLRITGTVMGARVPGWLDGIAKTFHLRTVEERNRILLEKYP